MPLGRGFASYNSLWAVVALGHPLDCKTVAALPVYATYATSVSGLTPSALIINFTNVDLPVPT